MVLFLFTSHLHSLVPAPPPAPENQPVEEEPFELPTLEEVARATGTLRPQPLSKSIDLFPV